MGLSGLCNVSPSLEKVTPSPYPPIMKTPSFLAALFLLAQSAIADPAADLKSLLEKGVTSGPEFERAVEALRSKPAEKRDAAEPPKEIAKLVVGSRTYEALTITAVTPDSISFRHDGGAATVRLEDLSEELRNAFGYDPELAKSYRAKLAHAALTAEAQRVSEEGQDRIKKATYQLKEAIGKGAIDAWVEVMQNSGGRSSYVLAHYGVMKKVAVIDNSGLSPKVRGHRLTEGGRKDEIVAVAGLSHLPDKGRWEGKLYPCGNYSYQSVGSGPRTVALYATTLERALKIASE
jgi:hypothetical protein